MNPSPTPVSPTLAAKGCQACEITVSQLVGEVYEAAPTADKRRLLEQLLRPLGVLALVAIANGVFAKIRLGGAWPELHVRLEDANRVHASDVTALVERVQQVSTDALDGLAQIVAASPVMTSSVAAAALVALLVQHARTRRADDRRADLARLPPGLSLPFGARSSARDNRSESQGVE